MDLVWEEIGVEALEDAPVFAFDELSEVAIDFGFGEGELDGMGRIEGVLEIVADDTIGDDLWGGGEIIWGLEGEEDEGGDGGVEEGIEGGFDFCEAEGGLAIEDFFEASAGGVGGFWEWGVRGGRGEERAIEAFAALVAVDALEFIFAVALEAMERGGGGGEGFFSHLIGGFLFGGGGGFRFFGGGGFGFGFFGFGSGVAFGGGLVIFAPVIGDIKA